MKNINAIILGAIFLLSASMAMADDSTGTYYVHSNSLTLKSLLKPYQDFGNTFSTELTSSQILMLKAQGVAIEPVQIRMVDAWPFATTTTYKFPFFTTTTYKPWPWTTTTTYKPWTTTTIYNPWPWTTTTTYKPWTTTTIYNPLPWTTTTVNYRSCYPSTQKPWGISMVNGGSGGAGVTVAVLDTGIDTNHPDLAGNVVKCVSKVTHYSADTSSCEDYNSVGHGTNVAGIIAANGGSDKRGIYGVAPSARLMVVKVCDRRGYCYSDDIAAGIRYAADNGANIISMSFSGTSLDAVEKNAIDYAASKGVLMVAAAGNAGPGADTIQYPAAYSAVVSVAAIDSNKVTASFSSRGINDGDYVRNDREIEFAAPGVSIYSTYNNGCYATLSGTSQATPHISGLAAKLWKGSASATRSYLKSIAQDIGPPGDDPQTGFGLPVAP